jgi:CelD/BcsL family acetyltransferase involved in cellulose biosynthesis
MTLAVERIETEAQFDAIAGLWQDLQQRTEADHPFLTFDWMRAWYRHLRAERRLALLVLRDDTGVRGIVPWCIGNAWRGRLPFSVVQFLGTGLSDRLDLLATGDREELLESSLGHLEENSIAWDMIDLREVPSESPTVAAIGAVAKRLGIECEIDQDSRCPYLPIDSDWETFYPSRFGARTRKKIRRMTRRIHEESGRFSILEAVPDGSPLLDQLAAIPQNAEYLGQQRVSIFSSASKRAFFEEILARFAERRWLYIGLLEVRDQPAAYRLSFIYRKKYYDYFIGFHRDLGELSPGFQLIAHVIQDCFRRGLEEADFLRGTEGWKSTWTDHCRRQVRIRLYRRGLRGNALRLAGRFKPWFERSGRQAIRLKSWIGGLTGRARTDGPVDGAND